MSDVIKLLPDSVANQIAAGEVIQRPASVVKELVENAVDAGADTISVVVRDAGRTLVQVVDNGSGMSATDARLAFERHSTSKITGASDLFSLRTMGFRGEALASIAAVAQVEMTTMKRDESMASRILISGSKVESQEPVAAAPGTNMMVKNLFFNVPARRKFLKKDPVELSNILHEFERLALVNPSINLTFVRDDTTVHQLLKGSLKQRIGQLFGKNLERQLIPVETETSIVKINGFVGLPENARKRGALQYLFVNGRNMRHPYFHKAVLTCYDKLIRPDEQPCYFLNFEVDPATIDVNIHPTKNEIKFENEQAIWQILSAAVRESLGRFNAVPAMDFDAVDVPDIPAFKPDATGLADLLPPADYNPFKESLAPVQHTHTHAPTWRRESANAISDWDKLYTQFASSVESNPLPNDAFIAPTAGMPEGDTPSAQPTSLSLETSSQQSPVASMQLKGKYILTRCRAGLMVIDQHRAHVRILYDRFLAGSGSEEMPSQQVIFPEIVNLTQTENIMLHEILPELNKMGFRMSIAGPNAWSIDGIPSAVPEEGAGETVKKIIDEVAKGEDVAPQRMRSVMALHLAEAAAIPRGKVLTETEIDMLVSSLFSLSAPTYTPDGKRVMAELPIEEIDRLFS